VRLYLIVFNIKLKYIFQKYYLNKLMTCIAKTEADCIHHPRIYSRFCKYHYYIIKYYKEYKTIEKDYYKLAQDLPLCDTYEDSINAYKISLKLYVKLQKVISLRTNFTTKYINPNFQDYGHILIIHLLKNKLINLELYCTYILAQIARFKKSKNDKIVQNDMCQDAISKDTISEDTIVQDTIVQETKIVDNKKIIKKNNTYDKLLQLINEIYDPIYTELHPKYFVQELKKVKSYIDNLPKKDRKNFTCEKNMIKCMLNSALNKYIIECDTHTTILINQNYILDKKRQLIEKEYSIDDKMYKTEDKLRDGSEFLSEKIVDKMYTRLQQRISILSEYKKMCGDLKEHEKAYCKRSAQSMIWWSNHIKSLRQCIVDYT
jgi:hypothetical protein